ncbi:Aminodeoxychorismate synthase component 1 [Novipirellula artificiosorum]|uniref:Aminodeoxychorismate synthase component 1 n=2 Tax=Novipirellula artificiosorum TaxID=2528016 RepID=A0A5C6DI42_9BACT|nr:Aminodeoxychorismate synthase component 1 [Novipirellula artificiosorum]
MSDPLRTLVAYPGDPDPWPTLQGWVRSLPLHRSIDLPPMQGGIAGLIGYEAATWLEAVGASSHNDFPTPAISLGLYDWVIATDHDRGVSWLISQGFAEDPTQTDDDSLRSKRAVERSDEVMAMLEDAMAMLENAMDRPDRPRPSNSPTVAPSLQSNFSSEQFRSAVAEIVERIRAGDFFQVNLAQRLVQRASISSQALFQRLRDSNPAPYSVYYQGAGFEVLSSSPELFIKLNQGCVETRPIKGTVRRTGDLATDLALGDSLLQSEKDRAENIMIVDLMRNDLSRVCTDESVRVRKLCQLERYKFVQHLVSIVEGRLRSDQNVVDLLKACFPGGSITGAPKIEAMRKIAQLEPHCRGPYCGSMGYISCSGDAEFNILIRTITATQDHWLIPVGGGITARSHPEAEEAETWAKAEGILRALPRQARRKDDEQARRFE